MRIFDVVIAVAVVTLAGAAVWVFVIGGPSGDTEAQVSQPPASEPSQAPEREAINRLDCDAIRGTDYLSSEERTWFLENCGESSPRQPTPAVSLVVSEDQPLPTDTPTLSEDVPPPTLAPEEEPPLPPPPAPPTSTPRPPEPAPTAIAQAPAGPIEYVGTHSAGGTIWFSLTPSGDRKVQSFVGHWFCGKSVATPDRILNLTNMRIIGSGFGYTSTRFLVTGVFSSNGEVSGTISYNANNCQNEVTWTASMQGACPVGERYNEIVC